MTMHRIGIVLLLVDGLAAAGQPRRAHRDYVPDKKTAERIAEAVLVGQYGEERVNAQLPLHADGSDKDLWIVQGNGHGGPMTEKGGNFGVWINKHSGCIGNVVDHMK